jgi:hypothetical protein
MGDRFVAPTESETKAEADWIDRIRRAERQGQLYYYECRPEGSITTTGYKVVDKFGRAVILLPSSPESPPETSSSQR